MKTKAIFHFSIDFLDKATGRYLGCCSGFADSDQEIDCIDTANYIAKKVNIGALKDNGYDERKVDTIIKSFTLVSRPGIGK